MVTLIYGEDTAASRNYYLTERNKHTEKVILDGATLTLTDLLQAMSGSGLFGDQQAVFIDELLSKRKASKELDEITASIATADAPVFLWESKDLTAKQVASIKGATIKQFKVPQTVFAFLDALAPRNQKKLTQLFHELQKDEDANYVLFMLLRQVRLLLALSSENAATISEVKRLAPWQQGKLQKQAKLFSQEQLITLHEKLYQLELGQKTGGLSMPLDKAIDFLLLSL